MRIYLSKYISGGNSYMRRICFPILCSVTLLILFILMIVFGITKSGGISSGLLRWMITLLLFLYVAGNAVLVNHIQMTAYRDALIFCTDINNNLYVVDARSCAPSYKGSWGSNARFVYKFFKVLAETSQIIERIKTDDLLDTDLRTGKLRTYAGRITGVEKLQQVSAGKFAVCKVTMGDGVTYTYTFDITNHGEELHNLLKHRTISKKWEAGRNQYTKQICISALLTVVCLGVCITSHPMAGILPDAVYFPSLFALFIPVIVLLTYITKRKKGE